MVAIVAMDAECCESLVVVVMTMVVVTASKCCVWTFSNQHLEQGENNNTGQVLQSLARVAVTRLPNLRASRIHSAKTSERMNFRGSRKRELSGQLTVTVEAARLLFSLLPVTRHPIKLHNDHQCHTLIYIPSCW